MAFVALALAGFGAIECPPYELLRLRLFSFGGYGLALAALALVIFGAYDSYPKKVVKFALAVKITKTLRIRRRKGTPLASATLTA